MKRVMLTHYSRHPEASGNPGDIVDAPDALADGWIQTRGAVLVATKAKAVAATVANAPQPIVVIAGEQPVKRKRGRPRKYVEENEQS